MSALCFWCVCPTAFQNSYETVTFFIGRICYGMLYLSGMTRYDMVWSVYMAWMSGVCVAGAYILSSFVSGYKGRTLEKMLRPWTSNLMP